MTHLAHVPAVARPGDPAYNGFEYVRGTMMQRGTLVTEYVPTGMLIPRSAVENAVAA